MSNPCLFCQIAAGDEPAAVVYQDDQALAFMDLFPLRPGHVLIIPRAHSVRVHEMAVEDRVHLIELANRIAAAMRRLDPTCDLNWIINDGKIADQHVPHVHLHLIPRHRGDHRSLGTKMMSRMLGFFGRPASRKKLAERARQIAEEMGKGMGEVA